jgi:hypothetical protein
MPSLQDSLHPSSSCHVTLAKIRDTAGRATTELAGNTEPESAQRLTGSAGSTDAQPAVSRFNREVRPGSTTSSDGHFYKVLNDKLSLGIESVLAGSGSGGSGVPGGLHGAAQTLLDVFHSRCA